MGLWDLLGAKGATWSTSVANKGCGKVKLAEKLIITSEGVYEEVGNVVIEVVSSVSKLGKSDGKKQKF